MALAELLSWDSEFFGFPVARVVSPALHEDQARSLDDWCRRNRVRCLYFLCLAEDTEATRTAEENGFHLVDIRITLRAATAGGHAASSPQIRPARPEEIPILEAISRECYQETRFYTDPGFPRSKAVELYETWIRRSCQGYADTVLVAELKGDPAGYVTCHLSGANIGLVGVSSCARGGGLGRLLVEHSLGWFRSRDVQDVFIVTQGRNVAAQRLYQRCGFLTHRVELWYHKWYHPE